MDTTLTVRLLTANASFPEHSACVLQNDLQPSVMPRNPQKSSVRTGCPPVPSAQTVRHPPEPGVRPSSVTILSVHNHMHVRHSIHICLSSNLNGVTPQQLQEIRRSRRLVHPQRFADLHLKRMKHVLGHLPPRPPRGLGNHKHGNEVCCVSVGNRSIRNPLQASFSYVQLKKNLN
jgi:hypothetical protein